MQHWFAGFDLVFTWQIRFLTSFEWKMVFWYKAIFWYCALYKYTYSLPWWGMECM